MPDSSHQTATRRRGPGRPFPPGLSGNPGGRPKGTDDVRQMAQQHTPEAIERLVFWLRSENARASVAAALAIIERGYGRPVQPLDVTHRPAPDLTQLTDAELATLETLLAKAERDPGAVH